MSTCMRFSLRVDADVADHGAVVLDRILEPAWLGGIGHLFDHPCGGFDWERRGTVLVARRVRVRAVVRQRLRVLEVEWPDREAAREDHIDRLTRRTSS